MYVFNMNKLKTTNSMNVRVSWCICVLLGAEFIFLGNFSITSSHFLVTVIYLRFGPIDL